MKELQPCPFSKLCSCCKCCSICISEEEESPISKKNINKKLSDDEAKRIASSLKKRKIGWFM